MKLFFYILAGAFLLSTSMFGIAGIFVMHDKFEWLTVLNLLSTAVLGGFCGFMLFGYIEYRWDKELEQEDGHD